MAWVEGHFLSGDITGKKITGEELNLLQQVAIDEDAKKMLAIRDNKTEAQFKSLLLTTLHKKIRMHSLI